MGLRGQQASRLHFIFWNDKEKAGKSLKGVLTQNAQDSTEKACGSVDPCSKTPGSNRVSIRMAWKDSQFQPDA